jgi:hypothetical protein
MNTMIFDREKNSVYEEKVCESKSLIHLNDGRFSLH